MIFIARRTSNWSDRENSNIPGAKQVEMTTTFYYSKETVQRTFLEWVIEINSLEELIAFQKEVGHEIIISEMKDAEKHLSLEVYDDYRE